MNSKEVKKKVISVGVATILGATGGISLDRAINDRKINMQEAIPPEAAVVVWNDDSIKDFSFLMGGIMGHYDYTNGSEKEPTNNEYYQKYYNELDQIEYVNGYEQGYQPGGCFSSYDNEKLVFNDADKLAIMFDTIKDGLVEKAYISDDYDEVMHIVNSRIEELNRRYEASENKYRI